MPFNTAEYRVWTGACFLLKTCLHPTFNKCNLHYNPYSFIVRYLHLRIQTLQRVLSGSFSVSERTLLGFFSRQSQAQNKQYIKYRLTPVQIFASIRPPYCNYRLQVIKKSGFTVHHKGITSITEFETRSTFFLCISYKWHTLIKQNSRIKRSIKEIMWFIFRSITSVIYTNYTFRFIIDHILPVVLLITYFRLPYWAHLYACIFDHTSGCIISYMLIIVSFHHILLVVLLITFM
jgi:hypothetical protein